MANAMPTMAHSVRMESTVRRNALIARGSRSLPNSLSGHNSACCHADGTGLARVPSLAADLSARSVSLIPDVTDLHSASKQPLRAVRMFPLCRALPPWLRTSPKSASSTRSCQSLVPRSGTRVATPALSVTIPPRWRAWRIARPRTARRIRSAMPYACRCSHPGRITAISSPPYLAAISPSRCTQSWTVRAIARRHSSPAGWP